MNNLQSARIAYILARVPIALSFIGHGLVRIPEINQFSNGMIQNFSDTVLPLIIVQPFSIILPFLELFLGLFLLIGLKMRVTTITGVTLISVLILGSSIQENWSAVAIQMFYGLYLAILYMFADYYKSLIEQK